MQTILERPAESLDSFHALTAAVHPAWHQAILRLASASERVAERMGWVVNADQDNNPASQYVQNCRDLVDQLLEFLDGLDADPDLEETADAEPSLGWLVGPACGLDSSDDREADDADNEPSLGSQEEDWRGVTDQRHWSIGNLQDFEGEHDGHEPGEDDEPDNEGEPSLGSVSAIDQQGWSDGGDGLCVDAELDETDPATSFQRVVCRLTDKGAEVLASVTLI